MDLSSLDPRPKGTATMHKQIHVNLAVADMAKSKAFFTALGYRFDPDFSNDQGAAMVLGENLHAMLLVRDYFQTFTRKWVADASGKPPQP
jgi:predicted lactoylglutathione lyase